MTANNISAHPLQDAPRLTRRVAFWVEWIIANMLGYILGIALCALLLWPLFVIVGWLSLAVGSLAAVMLEGVVGAVVGGAIGASQLFVLRLHGLRFSQWILFSAIGGALGLIFVAFLQQEVSIGSFTPVGYAIAGATIGASQWLVMVPPARRFGLWIFANAIGWAVGPLLSQALNLSILYSGFAGVVTGATLLWLLRQERSRQQVRTVAKPADQTAGVALWFIWMLANGIGVLITYLASVLIVSQGFTMRDAGAEVFALLPTNALGLGITLGILQWSVLRTRLKGAIWWIPANIVGWTIGILISSSLGSLGLLTYLTWAFIGLAVGLVQWIILRIQVRDANWWIPASIIGWIGSGLIVMQLGPIGALVYALITGLVLARFWSPQTAYNGKRPASSPHHEN